MEKGGILLILIGILMINVVVASSYVLEFNQLGKSLVVNESANNSQINSYPDSNSLNFAGRDIYFLNKVTFPNNFEEVKIVLNLEKGIIIKNKEVFPLGYNIQTDGETISINWDLNDVKKGDNFAIFVNLEDTKNAIFPFWSVFFIILILFGVFWLIVFKRKKVLIKKVSKIKQVKVKEKESNEYNYLLDTEKKIMEELKKANRNELWQKQIQNSTGFSKAKISRLIRNLESRGLITKIPFGNTNKIRLK